MKILQEQRKPNKKQEKPRFATKKRRTLVFYQKSQKIPRSRGKPSFPPPLLSASQHLDWQLKNQENLSQTKKSIIHMCMLCECGHADQPSNCLMSEIDILPCARERPVGVLVCTTCWSLSARARVFVPTAWGVCGLCSASRLVA